MALVPVWAWRAAAAVMLGMAGVGFWISGAYAVEWLQSPPDRFCRDCALILSLGILPAPIVFTVAALGLWAGRRWGLIMALVTLVATLLLSFPEAFSGSGLGGTEFLVTTAALIAFLLLLLGFATRRTSDDPVG